MKKTLFFYQSYVSSKLFWKNNEFIKMLIYKVNINTFIFTVIEVYMKQDTICNFEINKNVPLHPSSLKYIPLYLFKYTSLY